MEDPRFEITEEPDLRITLHDGTRLSARVWRPLGAGPVPVILEYLPYRKRDGTCARDALTHPWFAKRGYACLRVDIRGTGDSEGLMTDEYTQQELDDAVEVIHWAAEQDWCSGAVGMMGISWGGFNSLQVAALRPDPLKAIITLCSTDDRFNDDIHYKGGCLLNENLGWGATMWSYSARPPDPALHPNWREMWLERLEAQPFLPSIWLRHRTRDAYWKHGSVCEDYSSIKAKVLAIGGWGDAYKNSVRRLVDKLPGAKGIIGPWVHKYPHFAVPEPRIGFLQEGLRWWDRWLKDEPTGVEDDPAMRLYLMDGVRPATWYETRPGRWLADPECAPQVWHLSETGLQAEPAECARTIASPQDTGRDAGEYCAIWLGPELPGDQRRDDALSACFDTPPLDQDLAIAEGPVVELDLIAHAPKVQLAVRLNHVHPDGAATRVTYGVLNLAQHLGRFAVPGERVRVTLRLDDVAYRIPAGHRIRLAVSTAYWPLIWPTPDPGSVTLCAGSLSLPVTQTTTGWQFEPPDADAPWAIETLREAAHVRRHETDLVTGTTALIIEDDFGQIRDLDHGLISGAVARERWSIHPDDPSSARGTCHWSDTLERDGLQLRTEARCAMTADHDTFYLTAKLEAFEGETCVFSKEITDKIPRDPL